MRSKILEKDGGNSHFSRLLEQDPKNPEEFKQAEEEIMTHIGNSVLQIFSGCHVDSLKITMSLRGILLTNFQSIIEEVSMLCGDRVTNEIIEYLFDAESLNSQFKTTN